MYLSQYGDSENIEKTRQNVENKQTSDLSEKNAIWKKLVKTLKKINF